MPASAYGLCSCDGSGPIVTDPPFAPSPSLATRTFRGGDVSADSALLDKLALLIETHGTVYHWAANHSQPRAMRGRAPVYVATVPGTDETVVVRHGWHGGLFAPLTGDRFRFPTRAPREYAMSNALHAAGIPTTQVLGFARYRSWLGWCRVDVFSRFVPDAYDLGMVIAGLVPDIECHDALRATRTLLQQLASAGVVHPDLNVKNILLIRSATGMLTAMIIDVDVVRWYTERAPHEVMQLNVQRLVRSMRKWHRSFGCVITEDMLKQFIDEAMRGVTARSQA